MQLNTNIASLNAVRQLGYANQLLGQSLQRLSSGLRINSARDDAAGLQISNRLTSQIGGLAQSVRNANDGVSMLQTAEGAMQQVTDNLQRIRDLSLAAANGVNSADDRRAYQDEVNQLLQEISRINDTTTFGGRKLFTAGADPGDLNKRAVVYGLKSVWLADAEDRIRTYFGISGDGADITVNLDFTDGVGGALAAVSGTVGAGGKTDNLVLNVDMADFTPPNLPDGGNAPIYNDRIITHEMVHAVMGRAMDFAALPSWFKEGTAEFIHGGDERVNNDYAGGAGLAGILAAFNADDVSASAGYSAGYSAVRYLHQQIKAHGGNGIKDIMTYLNQNAGSTLDAAITNASHGAFANLAAFDAAFNANAGAFIAGFNFSDADTGAVGGLDVDGGASYDAKTIIPDAGRGFGISDQPLNGFNMSFPTLSELGGGGAIVDFQVGSEARQTITTQIGSVAVNALGISALDVVNAPGFATLFIDDALKAVDEQRARLGAVMNRLESTVSNLDNIQENVSASRSRIRDTDYAAETSSLAKARVLQQVGLSILAAANTSPNAVLQLLRAG